MAFPTVAATATSFNPDHLTNHIVSLPANIAAGNLLIIFFRGGMAGVAATPAGWTLLCSRDTSSVFRRVADGAEGATVTVTTAWNGRSAHVTFRITNQDPVNFIAGAFTGADSLDPPNLAPGWGIADILWLTSASGRRTNYAFTCPANYGNQLNAQSLANSGDNVHVLLSVARRNLTIDAENPATWTFAGAGSPMNSHASTVGVQGTAGSLAQVSEPMGAKLIAGRLI